MASVSSEKGTLAGTQGRFMMPDAPFADEPRESRMQGNTAIIIETSGILLPYRVFWPTGLLITLRGKRGIPLPDGVIC